MSKPLPDQSVTTISTARCTCDRSRPNTFNPRCPEHGEGTFAYHYREAVNRGDWAEVARLDAGADKFSR